MSTGAATPAARPAAPTAVAPGGSQVAPAAPAQPASATGQAPPAGAPAAVIPDAQNGGFLWPEGDVSPTSSKSEGTSLGQILLIILAGSLVLLVVAVVVNMRFRARSRLPGNQPSETLLAG